MFMLNAHVFRQPSPSFEPISDTYSDQDDFMFGAEGDSRFAEVEHDDFDLTVSSASSKFAKTKLFESQDIDDRGVVSRPLLFSPE